MNKTVSSSFVAAALLASPLQSRAAAPMPNGIPNFHQVTERLYRGGQPADGAWKDLSKLGVMTVVDLRRPGEHSTSAESIAVVAAGMRYVNFPIDGFETPTSTQIASVLPLLDGPESVFVHCKKGRDRTGTVIAAYRISRQRWENQKALSEAENRGLAWWNRGMRRFLAGYRAEPVVAPGADAEVAAATTVSEVDSTTAAVGAER